MAFPMTSSSVKRSRRLIAVWPALSDDARVEILALAGLRPDDVDDFNDVTSETASVEKGLA